MNAVLTGVAGPLAGQVFALSGTEVSIGRSPSSRILIPAVSASRQHCVIEEAGGQIQIRDLDSHNGTYVNGSPVKQALLQDGDRIEIGNAFFVFSSGDAPSHGTPVSISSAQSSTALTAGGASEALGHEAAILVKTSALARYARELYLNRDAPSQPHLERLLFQMIFEFLPAREAAIILTESRGEPQPLGAFDGNAAAGPGVEVKKAIIDAVIKAGAPMGGQENDLSWLAAPLVASDTVIGILYAGRSPARGFKDADAQTLTVVSEIIAREIQNARELDQLVSENRQLKSEVNVAHNMVGESASMEQLYRSIARVAPGTSTVLIRGESGTGKELVARAIHRNSARSAMPFVAINCAAVTETLLESELFGHEKGAFTGAVAQRKGKLETAEGGTLFLDEIGELAAVLQAKLLRVLQEREFERVGGTRTIPVDIRVLAATNRNLEDAIKGGGFREDLYYRLNVIAITVPPLRDRKPDIPLLATWFAEKIGAEVGRHVTGISKQARAVLMEYDWPGNIRELRNAIEHAVVLGSTASIMPEDLPETLLDTPLPHGREEGGFHDAVREAKKRLILEAIDQAKGNISEAARSLRLHPNYLHRLVTTLRLR
jgi:transcriptional regulator with GAF, ATPase, and Fis domain